MSILAKLHKAEDLLNKLETENNQIEEEVKRVSRIISNNLHKDCDGFTLAKSLSNDKHIIFFMPIHPYYIRSEIPENVEKSEEYFIWIQDMKKHLNKMSDRLLSKGIFVSYEVFGGTTERHKIISEYHR